MTSILTKLVKDEKKLMRYFEPNEPRRYRC